MRFPRRRTSVERCGVRGSKPRPAAVKNLKLRNALQEKLQPNSRAHDAGARAGMQRRTAGGTRA